MIQTGATSKKLAARLGDCDGCNEASFVTQRENHCAAQKLNCDGRKET